MPIISAFGLFCCDKLEEIPNEKVSNMSKLTKSYFSQMTTLRDNKLYSAKMFTDGGGGGKNTQKSFHVVYGLPPKPQ